jgi:hypothetical protein
MIGKILDPIVDSSNLIICYQFSQRSWDGGEGGENDLPWNSGFVFRNSTANSMDCGIVEQCVVCRASRIGCRQASLSAS